MSESVFAVVDGKPLLEAPSDLFIPPNALKVLLDSFTGPLDLLLYLIRRQNLDILDIPIALITHQYMQYIQLMGEGQMELASDYLVMAAMLAEIKSRLLLPVTNLSADEIEEDPRLVLVRRLQAYEQFKEAAQALDDLPRYERDVYNLSIEAQGISTIVLFPDVFLFQLTDCMHDLIKQQSHLVHHQISREPLSVRERMTNVLERVEQEKSITLSALLSRKEGRMGLIVTLLAILELARQSLLIIIQPTAYAPIYLQANDHG